MIVLWMSEKQFENETRFSTFKKFIQLVETIQIELENVVQGFTRNFYLVLAYHFWARAYNSVNLLENDRKSSCSQFFWCSKQASYKKCDMIIETLPGLFKILVNLLSNFFSPVPSSKDKARMTIKLHYSTQIWNRTSTKI